MDYLRKLFTRDPDDQSESVEIHQTAAPILVQQWLKFFNAGRLQWAQRPC